MKERDEERVEVMFVHPSFLVLIFLLPLSTLLFLLSPSKLPFMRNLENDLEMMSLL